MQHALALCPPHMQAKILAVLALFHVHSGSQKKAADTMKRALEIFQCPASKLIGHWALSYMLWHDNRHRWQSLRHLDEARQIFDAHPDLLCGSLTAISGHSGLV